MLVSNMQSRNGNPVPNQFILSDGAKVTFQSYSSHIATVDMKNKTIELGVNWHYSRTTDKYRNAFFGGLGFNGLSTTADMTKAIKAGCYKDYTIKEL